MNVERLHAIAKAVSNELRQTDLIGKMDALQSALTNQVNTPQEPSYQQAVATSRQELVDVLTDAPSNNYAPTWRQAIEELGFSDLLGAEGLLHRVDEIFNRNQITASVAQDEVSQLATDVQALATALQSMLDSFAYFKIGSEELDPGEAEVGVLIPREAVKDQLPKLGHEFKELQKILAPFLELAEGSRPPLKVRTISSTDFAVYVAMGAGAAYAVAQAMDKILDVYKKVLDIRAAHKQLADNGVPPEVLAPLEEHANDKMAEETRRIADEMVDASTISSTERANELKIEVRYSLNALANRIDHGYNVDVRAQPDGEAGATEDDDEAVTVDGATDREALRRITELAPNLAFVNRSGKPILSLPEGATIDQEPSDDGEHDSSEEPSAAG